METPLMLWFILGCALENDAEKEPLTANEPSNPEEDTAIDEVRDTAVPSVPTEDTAYTDPLELINLTGSIRPVHDTIDTSTEVNTLKAYGYSDNNRLILFFSDLPEVSCIDVVRSYSTTVMTDPALLYPNAVCNILWVFDEYNPDYGLNITDDIFVATQSNFSCAIGDGEWQTNEWGNPMWTGIDAHFWTGIPFRYNLGIKGDTESGLNVNLKITEMKGRFQTEIQNQDALAEIVGSGTVTHCPELAYITF